MTFLTSFSAPSASGNRIPVASGKTAKRVYSIMPMVRNHTAALIGCWALLLPLGWGQEPSKVARDLFAAANRERKSKGLAQFKWDEALATAAQAHALEMAKHNSVAHQFHGEETLPVRVKKAGARYSWLAENVDAGASAAAIHQQFMNSPNHRANLLDKDMDSIGIGAVQRAGQWFVTEDISKAR